MVNLFCIIRVFYLNNFTFFDVVPVDDEVVISVRPVLLVIEAQCVCQLVDHRPHPVAAGADGHGLLVSCPAYVRVTSDREKND